MTLPREIARLVETFDRNIESYRQGRYNEAQVRKEFIDPLFKVLGWDVDNEKGWAEAYKDVIHEDAIRIGQATKAPDYCFRIGGTRKFFLEAKKPSINIKDDPSPAYQLRRYAWSAKLPLSILTDFEEFAVYDCRVRPHKTDKPATARIMYVTYDKYAEHWHEIASIFSRDAVLKGSFDKYAQTEKRKRGTAEVDAAFLAEIETWRENLARNIALRNTELSNRELNFAVQRTIDRIVFLRICEDRGIERYGQLMGLLNGPSIYQRLMAVFRRADDRYNSGLFHFMHERDRTEGPDELTPELIVDDKPLREILRSLYYPDSPYEFSVLPAEILGHVYEQFLGKVITLTAGHRARVEDKPEVKKAGGVYYTPSYIVDYIVEHTVGKLLEDRCVEIAKISRGRGKKRRRVPVMDRPLRVLDPACGSGSFLLGAYQTLLNWHRDYYDKHDPQQWAKLDIPPICQAADGSWKLTTAERKRILLDHIYGVDIDAQAVEVTKLSLLLRVLEGEKNLVLFHNERALPDLADNIKCGNSLIGPDFYEGKQSTMFDEEECLRINAFDWKAEFPHIFKDGGFDAVIGNPPYVRIQTLKETQPESVPYFSKHYRAAAKGNYDIYVVFVEQALNLLNPKGKMGYILPHKFFNSQYGQPLRKLIADGRHLSHVVHFGDQQVFDGATTYTCLLFLQRRPVAICAVAKVPNLTIWKAEGTSARGDISLSRLSGSEWNFVVGPGSDLYQRLRDLPCRLGDIATLFVGLQTDADDVYILNIVKPGPTVTRCYSSASGEVHEFETKHLKPLLKGSLNITRYHLRDLDKCLIFPYQRTGAQSVLIDAQEYAAKFPLTWKYLLGNRTRLASRGQGRLGSQEWYGYVYKKNHLKFELPKLVVPSIATGAAFAEDLEGAYYFVGSGGGGGGGYGIVLNDPVAVDPLYVLALLNSRVTTFFLRVSSTSFRGGYLALNRQYIEHIPLQQVEVTNRTGKVLHDKIASFVPAMLQLHKELASARTADQKTALQRQIEATDRQIDALVYELYGLSDDEIQIVEAATTR